MTFVENFSIQFNQPRTFLSSGFAGTLGSAVATGIGAKAGAPDRTVVTITGDGGFLFTATELASAVQHNIRAITVVFNDNAFGNVRRIQQERFGVERTIASTLVNRHRAFAKARLSACVQRSNELAMHYGGDGHEDQCDRGAIGDGGLPVAVNRVRGALKSHQKRQLNSSFLLDSFGASAHRAPRLVEVFGYSALTAKAGDNLTTSDV